MYFQDSNRVSIQDIIKDKRSNNQRGALFITRLQKAIDEHESKKYFTVNKSKDPDGSTGETLVYKGPTDFISRNIQ
jgi:hypothetical protein